MKRVDLSALTFDNLLRHEWLAVNKIGGYACSTLPGLNSRKYHGLLIAAMSPPVRRMVLLSRVEETVISDGKSHQLACNEYPGAVYPNGHEMLRAFNADPFPRWGYQAGGWTLEKSLRLIEGENTVCITYTLLGGGKSVDLELRPLLALRPIHELMYQWNGKLMTEIKNAGQVRVPPTARTPEVFLTHDGTFERESHWYLNTIYRREEQRGYSGLEDLWMPGVVRWNLAPGQSVNFVCSTDPVDLARIVSVMDHQFAQAVLPAWADDAVDHTMDALIRAADYFPLSIPQDNAPPKTAVVTQYPWGQPNGRDILISLAGLFLVPGKFSAAKALLETFRASLKNGLMPSHWPEDGSPPLYHGADISLWFINAAWQYLQYSGDENVFRNGLFDTILQILHAYQRGAGLGIRADADGLIVTQQPGVPTTWMDAKISDWVVTPRQGRTVEINALWYNALCIASRLADRLRLPNKTEQFKEQADRVKASFNARFWNAEAGCLFDSLNEHGPDASIRPNQLFAISLPFAALQIDRHAPVLEKVKSDLLTPYGLRTLSPRATGYQGRYAGNIVLRDRAYHQGSAFPWLLGAYSSALSRIHGRSQAARDQVKSVLQPCIDYLMRDGLGQLCELFDGDLPQSPGGAIASGLAVGELLRAYAEDVLNQLPPAASVTVINSRDAAPIV